MMMDKKEYVTAAQSRQYTRKFYDALGETLKQIREEYGEEWEYVAEGVFDLTIKRINDEHINRNN